MKRTAIAFGVVLLAFLGCQFSTPPAKSTNAASAGRPSAHAASAQFDFYLLNLSWSPEFCHSHPAAAECATHSTFVLHGLWPQNNDGTYPHNCSSAPGPADPSQYSDIYPDPSLLRHEWTTHGTCSGLAADAYFSAARKAFHAVTVPPKLAALTSQTSLPLDQILGLFKASNPSIAQSDMALSCGNNYLTAVEICLDKSLQPIPCSSVRSCRANTVKIPPP